MSNFLTSLMNADLNLSVTMTFLSTILSFGMTTFWAWLLGRSLVQGDGTKDPTAELVKIPYLDIAVSLIFLTIPLSFGILFKYKWSSVASNLSKWTSKPCFMIILIIVFVGVVWSTHSIIHLFTWRHITCGALLACLGLSFGAILATVCKLNKSQIIAISIETAVQNIKIAVFILNVTFISPFCDMAMLPFYGYFYFLLPIVAFIVGNYIWHKCRSGNLNSQDLRKKRPKPNSGSMEMQKMDGNAKAEIVDMLL